MVGEPVAAPAALWAVATQSRMNALDTKSEADLSPQSGFLRLRERPRPIHRRLPQCTDNGPTAPAGPRCDRPPYFVIEDEAAAPRVRCASRPEEGRIVTLTRVERKLAAILVTDVVGYSRLMGVDEAGTARRLREHQAAISPIVKEH